MELSEARYTQVEQPPGQGSEETVWASVEFNKIASSMVILLERIQALEEELALTKDKVTLLEMR